MTKIVNVGELDDRAVKYALMTDEEAAAQVQQVKDRIKEIKASADIGKDPRLVWELRELTNSLAWYKTNKNRSKFFKIITPGASMRRAKRHPNAESFKRNNKN